MTNCVAKYACLLLRIACTEKDLKHGDLRLKLISHAMDPKGLRKEVIEQSSGFESEFEELVYTGLVEADFRTVHRCQVGEYVIDLVVEGGGGKRVAIQCDGDRHRRFGLSS